MADKFTSTHEHLLDIKFKPFPARPPQKIPDMIREFVGANKPPLQLAQPKTFLPQVTTMQPDFVTAATAIQKEAKVVRPIASIVPEPSTPRSRLMNVFVTGFAIDAFKGITFGAPAGSNEAAVGGKDEEKQKGWFSRFGKVMHGIFEPFFAPFKKGGMLSFGALLGYALMPVFDVLKNTLMPLLVPLQTFLINVITKVLLPMAQTVLPRLQEAFLNLAKWAIPHLIKASEWVTAKIMQFVNWIATNGKKELELWINVFVNEWWPTIKKSAIEFWGLIKDVVGGIKAVNEYLGGFKNSMLALFLVFGTIKVGQFVSMLAGVKMALAGVKVSGGIVHELNSIGSAAVPAASGLTRISTLLGQAGLVAGAAAAGYALGTFLDDLFGFSDKAGSYLSKQQWFTDLVGGKTTSKLEPVDQRKRNDARAARIEQNKQQGWTFDSSGNPVSGPSAVVQPQASVTVESKNPVFSLPQPEEGMTKEHGTAMITTLSSIDYVLKSGFAEVIRKFSTSSGQQKESVIAQGLVLS